MQTLPLKRNHRRFLDRIVSTGDSESNEKLVESLGLSIATIYRYRKSLKDETVTEAKDLCKVKAIKMIGNLDDNASNGDTGAAVKILEIGGVYVPKQIGGAQGTVNLGIIVLPTREILPGEPVEVEVIEESKP